VVQSHVFDFRRIACAIKNEGVFNEGVGIVHLRALISQGFQIWNSFVVGKSTTLDFFVKFWNFSR
jgi:hypothetical protein